MAIPFSTTARFCFYATLSRSSDHRQRVLHSVWGLLTACLMPARKFCQSTMRLVPGRFTMNVRLSKTFGFGKKAEPGHRGEAVRAEAARRRGGVFGAAGGAFGLGSATDRRYSLTFTVNARNIFNNVNLATPNGTLGSPLFAQSNALAGFGLAPVAAVQLQRRPSIGASIWKHLSTSRR